MSRDYLTTADVLGLHAILLERYGGASGIRDMGAVESSVYRPQCGYYADIVEEACALMESLLINQPFVDGNKRTAFAAFDIFLRINGKHLKMDSARTSEESCVANLTFCPFIAVDCVIFLLLFLKLGSLS